jgi:hypothetical protein
LAAFQDASTTKCAIAKDGAITSEAGLGLHGNSAPSQHSATGDATGFVAGGGTTATSTSTWQGSGGTGNKYTVGDIVTALKDVGILA